jgi:Ca-activated chloride channel homolog
MLKRVWHFSKGGNTIEIVFENPSYLWLLVSVFILVITYNVSLGWSRKKAVKFANFDAIAQVTKRTILPRSFIPLIIKCLILFFIILSVSGFGVWYDGYSSDLDYVLAIDSSGSMLADDFDPNRLEAAKDVAKDFVDELGLSVKVGVVSFTGSSFIDQSLTEDKLVIKDAIDSIKPINIGGTAIGDAIVLSSNLLILSGGEEKGRSVILLTDGRSNVGIPVEDAVDYATDKGVVINTIGMGTEDGGNFIDDFVVSTLDTETLQEISENTGGSFYLATTKDELKEAYLEVFSVTKTRVFFDPGVYLLILAFILLLLEWALSNTRYKTIV